MKFLRRRELPHISHIARIEDFPATDRRWLWRAGGIICATGAVLAVLLVGRSITVRILAEHYRSRLATAEDTDQAATIAASTAGLGRPGIPILAGAMRSPREPVARTAANCLLQLLENWERVSNPEGQRNIATLAECLSANVETYDPAARCDAARMAHRILRWRLDRRVVDAGRVTRCCEKVLRTTNFSLPDETISSEESRPVLVALEEPARSSLLAESQSEPPLAAKNLGYPADRPDRIRPPASESLGFSRLEDQAPLPSQTSPLDSTPGTAWAMRGHSLASPADSPPRLLPPSEPETAESHASPEPLVLLDTPEAAPIGSISDLSDDECMRMLHAAGLVALEADAELKRRGYDPLQLSIARRVRDPDRRVRLQLVRDLPSLEGVDTSGWLLKMTGDEDEEVRLAAITLLATSPDREIRSRVERIAAGDRSERIRTQAERLARRNRGSLY